MGEVKSEPLTVVFNDVGYLRSELDKAKGNRNQGERMVRKAEADIERWQKMIDAAEAGKPWVARSKIVTQDTSRSDT